MKGQYFNIQPVKKASYQTEQISDELLGEINGLKQNGPSVPLTKDDIHVRSMYCIGESPTTKQSVHPEGEIAGKEVRVLSRLADLLPGAPMMEGHRVDKIPWARVFKAQVEDVDGEKTVKAYYYFLAGIEKYETIAREIDAGIRSEGSISYFFKKACCSICTKEMEIISFFGMMMTKPSCSHKLGEEYEGKKCYWYPQPESIVLVAELSHVYRGAYRKTKNVKLDVNDPELCLNSEEEKEGFEALTELIENRSKDSYFPVTCSKCFTAFDASKMKLIDDQHVECPGCKEAVNNEGKVMENIGWKYCTCPKCGYSQDKKAGEQCRNLKCPKCDTPLQGSDVKKKSNAGDSNNKVKCAGCGHEFDYGSESELSPGAVKCPECKNLVNQEGELVGVNTAAKLFSPVGPVKPAKSGVVNNEFFDLEDFKKLEGDFMVEPKYDGVWMEMHRDGDKVKIYSDEGNEHSEKFPGIVADAQAERGDKFIIAGEMVKMRGRQRLGHEDVSAYIHSKGPYEDQHFRFKVFDIMLAKGEDFREKSLADRRKKLDAVISNTDQIHKTKFDRSKGGDDLVKSINDESSREGAMIKSVESRYNKDGEKTLYKWKRQFEVDAKVSKKEKREGGGFIYTCEVGRGDNAQEIGKTFTTSIDAKDGEIIRVSVDKVTEDEDGKFTWFAPKVISLRDDKSEPDPISTLKKISVKKGAGEPVKDGNIITLGEVVPVLLSAERDYPIYLCGGIVEKGMVTNDVDIIVKDELSEEQNEALRNCFPEEIRERIDVCYDKEGPAGLWIELSPESAQRYARAWKNAKKFVIQKHWWGNKAHWDVRFGAPKTPRMWGWTCFSEPSKSAGGSKVRCQEKKYHDPAWMDKDGEIKVGEIGNPTKNLTAHMKIIDKGDYRYIIRKPKFLEVVLDGNKFKGRYVWRQVDVKAKAIDFKVNGDESGIKSEKIWIMWKPKDQKLSTEGGKIGKIAFRFEGNNVLYWESDEPDNELTDAT